jgi:2-hydroxycyclohexanecarboxyl-CoA dehydrogenase
MRYDGTVAIVTGAGSGIGRATALALAAEGGSVAVADLDGARARAVAAEIGRAGGHAHPIEVDVTQTSSVKTMVATVLKESGRVDVLVSNAGWDRIVPFLETDEQLWNKVIAVNYWGHLACLHAVLPSMVERGEGRVVIVASDAGRVGSSGEAVYSGAKGAAIAFMKAAAREVARRGVTVNCVAPGLTDTAMLAGVREGHERLFDSITRAIPLGRVGAPEEVASAILYLASTEACYITGQTLSVDGGLTML